MKSGLYSTFTIQSLQNLPNPRPIKSELLLQQDSAPKAVSPVQSSLGRVFVLQRHPQAIKPNRLLVLRSACCQRVKRLRQQVAPLTRLSR